MTDKKVSFFLSKVTEEIKLPKQKLLEIVNELRVTDISSVWV